jgi:hypothetical protein
MKATMPGITIELDGKRIATINLEGMTIMDVSVNGALDQNPKAELYAMGGNYSEGECGHLIWVDDRSLLPGETLCVRLTEECDNWDNGQTIDDLYPDDEPSFQTDFAITDEMAAELRARPRLHEAFSVQVKTSHGENATAVSNELNTIFTFRVS